MPLLFGDSQCCPGSDWLPGHAWSGTDPAVSLTWALAGGWRITMGRAQSLPLLPQRAIPNMSPKEVSELLHTGLSGTRSTAEQETSMENESF